MIYINNRQHRIPKSNELNKPIKKWDKIKIVTCKNTRIDIKWLFLYKFLFFHKKKKY